MGFVTRERFASLPLWKRTLILLSVCIAVYLFCFSVQLIYSLYSCGASRLLSETERGDYVVSVIHDPGSDTRGPRLFVKYTDGSMSRVLLSSDWHDSASVEFLDSSTVLVVLINERHFVFPEEPFARDSIVVDLANPPRSFELVKEYGLRYNDRLRNARDM